MKTKNLFLATILVAFGAINESIAQANSVTIGYQAGAAITSGGNNVFIGVNSGPHMTNGSGNVFVGCESGRESLTGNFNTFIGNQTSLGNSTGTGNTSIGSASGYGNTSGQYNTNIGYYSGIHISEGLRNSCFGYNSGWGLYTGSNNTFLGSVNVGGNSNISNSIILADGAENQRFYIDQYGNAGIGLGNNVTPNNKLEIKSGIANNSGLRFTNLKSSFVPTTTASKFLTVDANGDVVLQNVSGTGGSGNTTITAGQNIVVTGDSTAGYTVSSPTTNTLVNNGINRMTSTVNGVVAKDDIINTVENTIEFGQLTTTVNGVSSTPVTLPTSGSGTDTSIYANDGTLASNRIVTMDNNNLIFNTTGNTTTTGGRVYIGNTTDFTTANFPTTTGDYRLYVEGGVLTEKVKVALRNPATSWADYVFAKDYKLMPLNEVETFVKTNKHLPGVSSAEDLVKDGLDLGEMQAKQMEKIEELTLYAIEQNKKIEKQGKEIEKQGKEIEKQGKEIEELKALVKALVDKK